MKKRLKLLASCLAMSLFLSFSAAAFTDMPEGADGECLQRAVDNGLLTGFDDDTVRPGEDITRAQMATIMVRALGAEKMADISEFSDVTSENWYYEAMAKAVEMEAFKGSDDKKLNPENSITRQEAMIVLSRVFDLAKTEDNVFEKFTDGETVADWAKEEVSRLVAGGYTEQEGELRPLDKMTRLEFAQIMDKLVTVYVNEEGEFKCEDLEGGNVLVRADNVELVGAENGSVLFIGDGVKTETKLTDCEFGRISVRGGRLLLNSGVYVDIRAVGKGTEIVFENAPATMFERNEEGSLIGSLYGKPGYGLVIIPTFENIEVQPVEGDKDNTDEETPETGKDTENTDEETVEKDKETESDKESEKDKETEANKESEKDAEVDEESDEADEEESKTDDESDKSDKEESEKDEKASEEKTK